MIHSRRIVLISFSCLVVSAAAIAQVNREPPPDAKRFVLFIHGGAQASKPPEDLTSRIALTLARRGYVVKSPEKDLDEVGGPGVDYFHTEDRVAAQDIADTVNSILPSEMNKLPVRLQRITNPSGYIGVWLYK